MRTSSKILSYSQAIKKIKEFKEEKLKVVLAQGIFDVVHVGHIDYFRAARKGGDLLFVGVECDETVRLNKGQQRPFNSLKERLDFLSGLESIDYVFSFEDSPFYGSKDLDKYIKRFLDLSPHVLAVPSWDPNLEQKCEVIKRARVKLLLISTPKRNSTTRLLELIGYE